jgi:outer membrane protein assembly factor BamE (lipoprotein component of BamABCDE complex)
MLYVSPRIYSGRTPKSACKTLAKLAGAVILAGLVSVTAQAQRTKSVAGAEPDNPAFTDFRGVKLGMTADDARKKLGSPRDKGSDQDFYLFDENKAVQVYYDKSGMVSAISIDFMSGANGIPTPKEVLGSEPDTKSDGSLYKMIRYPKAGYWVSYSRTAGTSPTTTITMQKIDH